MTTIPVVSSSTIIGFLKIALGLPLLERSEAEQAVPLLPVEIHDLDAGAFMTWTLVGLTLCARPAGSKGWSMPVAKAIAAAKAAAFGLAMARHNHNKTHAARAVSTSRRRLRQHLKEAGLDPWPAMRSPMHTVAGLIDVAQAWQGRKS